MFLTMRERVEVVNTEIRIDRSILLIKPSSSKSKRAGYFIIFVYRFQKSALLYVVLRSHYLYLVLILSARLQSYRKAVMGKWRALWLESPVF